MHFKSLFLELVARDIRQADKYWIRPRERMAVEKLGQKCLHKRLKLSYFWPKLVRRLKTLTKKLNIKVRDLDLKVTDVGQDGTA